MFSKTTEVFGEPRQGYYRIFYNIENSRQLETALAQTDPVVLMFWAKWNEPCKVMMKTFRDMALAKRRQAIFCKLDVDKFKDIVEKLRVEAALPTFLLMKDRVEKGRVVGAKVDELYTTIKQKIDPSIVHP